MKPHEHARQRAIDRTRIADQQGGRIVYRACCPRCGRKRAQRHRPDCDLIHPDKEANDGTTQENRR